MILLSEVLLAALLLPLIVVAPRWLRLSGPIERLAICVTRRRKLSVVLVFVLSLVLRLAVLPLEPVPVPGIHDEFGYLLSADTFAHGRVTNPPHKMWVHFESITIIQQPTYCSAFWPAQGIFLAVGEVLFGDPFWGVCLSVALMCAAVSWALQGWMSSDWALLGGILAALRIGTFTYWANSYWGGAVAAIGGALVFGSLPRIFRRAKTRDALMMGSGIALLLNSRPYEGLVYMTAILIFAAVILKQRSEWAHLSARFTLLPLAATLLFTFACMAYYFWRTTGHPFRSPYVVNWTTYMQQAPFIFQSISPAKHYNHAVLQQFYGNYHLQLFLRAKHSPIVTALGTAAYYWIFFVGPLLTIPFVLLAWILPYGLSVRQLGRKTLFFLAVLGFCIAASFLPPAFNPHYAGASTCLILALILQAMRRVAIWDRTGQQKGKKAVRALVTACIAIFCVSAAALGAHLPHNRLFPFDPVGPNVDRARILHQLSHQPGKHLVIVHYDPNHDLHKEWVYNDAKIDTSKVVWAREMSTEENCQLLEYFKDRRGWVINADSQPPDLEPLSPCR